MNKILLNVLYVLYGLVAGISAGWLVHFDVVPNSYLIIAGAVLLVCIIVFLIVISNKNIRNRVTTVPAIIGSVTVFFQILAILSSQVFFTALNGAQIIIFILTALLIAVNNYMASQRMLKKLKGDFKTRQF